MAYFSDTESSTDNTVQAGTLDLTLDGGGESMTFLDEGSIAPGDSGSETLNLENAGSLPGTLKLEVTNVDSKENEYVGGENAQNDPSSDGELEEYLELRAFLGETMITDWQKASTIPVGQSYQLTSLSSEESATFEIEWRLQSADNVAQSDSFSFDLAFRLIQEGHA